MKLINAVCALILTLCLLISPVSASSLDDIMKSGVLKVGTTGDFPGWSFKNPETNDYEGFDIDVARSLAESMGVEVEFVATDWENLVSGVVSSNCLLYTSPSPRDP